MYDSAVELNEDIINICNGKLKEEITLYNFYKKDVKEVIIKSITFFYEHFEDKGFTRETLKNYIEDLIDQEGVTW